MHKNCKHCSLSYKKVKRSIISENDKTPKTLQNKVNRSCGNEQNHYFALRMIVKIDMFEKVGEPKTPREGGVGRV